ncbi:hypothetical protein KMC49_gp40 [Ralstonia phage Firinga]|uniref:Uncharacterized protein n=1 Tax=Ralstonia phage Firinga TaxID=2759725 RepID=A0A7G5B9Y5_9CAUD|nr:hypothetical protein KMC49_gp40 [Ralstonia phage Firinga]QMV33108.1 hypothetical protein 18C_00040 [Ralstonia phage Firinga]
MALFTHPEASATGLSDGWKQAAEWVRDNYQDYANIASLVDAMLARASAATACVACEGSPSSENNPCAVCGRAATVGEASVADDDVFTWLETEISAVDCRYRGDPSYDHDAYWMRERVLKLVKEAKDVFGKVAQQQAEPERCQQKLRIAGKPYPRTCRQCGLGPCSEIAPQQAAQRQVSAVGEANKLIGKPTPDKLIGPEGGAQIEWPPLVGCPYCGGAGAVNRAKYAEITAGSNDERRLMQLAAISTAAFGYWKDGDNIHPDYDSTALRDTAKLYAKYDELFKAAQQQAEPRQDRRRSFEVAEVSRGNDITRGDDGLYVNQFVQERWEDFDTQQAGPGADETNPILLWAEIHRLRAEAQGPDGCVTWKDAAIAERKLRVAAQSGQRAGVAPEYVMVQRRMRPTRRPEGEGWTDWEECSEDIARDCERVPVFHGQQHEVRWLFAAQSGQRAGVAGDVIEAAAKKLAKDFDCPWEHMPAQWKDDFRTKVRSIAAMLAAPTK